MSLWRDEAHPPPAAIVVVGVLGLVAALSLSRAFEAPAFLLWGVPGVAVGVTFATTIGRRSLGVAFGLLVAVWMVTLPVLFAREIATLPTRRSFEYAYTLFASGLSGVMREAPPVPLEPRYLLIVWTAGLSLGFLAASWVIVGRPLGAAVTALGVLTFAGTIGVGPGRDLFAFAGAAGLVTFLLAEGRHRIARWARSRPVMPAVLGVPTMLVASFAGLSAPFILGADPLVDLQTPLRQRLVIIKPLSDIQRQLDVEPPVEVMRVEADEPAYWRLTALDTYEGSEWVLEARPRPAEPGPVPLPDPEPRGRALEQRYHITSLLAPWLPAAYAAGNVDTPVPFEVDLDSSTLLLDGDTIPGLTYTVTSRLPAAPRDGGEMQQWEPDAVEEHFGELAGPLVEGAETPREKALALEGHFRAFQYNEDVPGGHSVERLGAFLEERSGYCEQFAATMTLMLRGLGIPARVGVGFLPGGINERNEFVVSTQDAHAWVEAYMPGTGWTSFDPTPGRGEPQGDPVPEEEQPAPPETPDEAQTPPPADNDLEPPPPPEEDVPDEEPDSRFPLFPGLLVALAVSVVPGAKTLRRTLRGGGTPGNRVLGAYAELVDRASELGWEPGSAETEREFYRRAFASSSTPHAAERVISLALLTRYGPRAPTDDEATEAWQSLRPAVSSLRGRVSRLRRISSLFDPRPLLVRRGR